MRLAVRVQVNNVVVNCRLAGFLSLEIIAYDMGGLQDVVFALLVLLCFFLQFGLSVFLQYGVELSFFLLDL